MNIRFLFHNIYTMKNQADLFTKYKRGIYSHIDEAD